MKRLQRTKGGSIWQSRCTLSLLFGSLKKAIYSSFSSQKPHRTNLYASASVRFQDFVSHPFSEIPLLQRYLFILGGAVLIGTVILGIHVWKSGVYASVEQPGPPSVEVIRHPLTGARLDSQIAVPWVYALMIDNSADAWPQRGVDQAFLVIEALAEGRIPRFLAFYSSDQSVAVIGPIRSARPYFIDWASGLGALFGHVGGSPEALNELAMAPILDLDQYYHGQFYWRSIYRSMPHNVYTSTDFLAQGLTTLKEEGPTPTYTFWTFKDDTTSLPLAGGQVNASVDFGADEYTVEWKYDSDLNGYRRYQGGAQTIMEDGAEIIANNVIILYTDVDVIDAIGRRQIRTTGTGLAELYQDGVVEQVTWKKKSASAPLNFFGEDGSEVKMNAGRTWIEVVE